MSMADPTSNSASQGKSVKTTEVKELKLSTAVLALDATPDGRRLFAACFDGGIYEINSESGENEKIGQHDSFASGVWLLAKTNRLISAGYDGELQWHDLAERKLVHKVQAHKFWSWQLAASPDENRWRAPVR